jgi:hypothetical protein
VTTRGIRNNNPGNLAKTKETWVGQIDGPDPRFVTFRTAQLGIRALAKTLLTYEDKHGLRTLKDIITRFAPPEENDTEAYIAAVCHDMHTGPRDVISLHRQLTLLALVMSIIKHENGVQPYGPAVLMEGVNLALGHP